jgi:hypothetical protein
VIQRPILHALLVALVASTTAACSPVRIKLGYRQRPPSAERAGRISFGTLADERRNPAEVAPDVSVAPGTPSVLETTETIMREGLGAAGWEVVPDAPLRIDARLHTAWAHQTFYNVQANIQLTVELHRAPGRGEPIWRHRFGVVDASGGSDARTNHQEAFKKALSKLAAEVAEAFGSSTFAEAFAAAAPAASAPPK